MQRNGEHTVLCVFHYIHITTLCAHCTTLSQSLIKSVYAARTRDVAQTAGCAKSTTPANSQEIFQKVVKQRR